MRKTFFAALVLMALTACKNNVKETTDVIDLPRAETPDSVAKAMDGFFEQAVLAVSTSSSCQTKTPSSL